MGGDFFRGDFKTKTRSRKNSGGIFPYLLISKTNVTFTLCAQNYNTSGVCIVGLGGPEGTHSHLKHATKLMKTIEEVYDDYLYDCYIANRCLTEEDWLYYGREEHHIEVPNRDGGMLTPLNSQYLTTYQHWIAGVLQSEVLQKVCFAAVPKNTLRGSIESLRLKWAVHSAREGARYGSVKGGNTTYLRQEGLFKLTRQDLQAAARKADKRKSIILTHPCGREERFPSITEAANTYNLIRTHLCAVMKGKRKQHKGFTARYVN